MQIMIFDLLPLDQLCPKKILDELLFMLKRTIFMHKYKILIDLIDLWILKTSMDF